MSKPRGFAAMDPEKVRAIASKGGKAAQMSGKAHQFSTEEAKEAGKKGGAAPHVRRGRGAKRPADPEETDAAIRAANGLGES
jgi:uncharacterized protein